MTTDDAVIADRLPALPPSWLPIRALPEYARKARAFVSKAVDGSPHDPDDISLVTSEIVTNAIRATAALREWPDNVYPIDLNLVVTDQYVHLAVPIPTPSPCPPGSTVACSPKTAAAS